MEFCLNWSEFNLEYIEYVIPKLCHEEEQYYRDFSLM